MQWGQIKTLLIISFLVLDIYLFVQFLEKKAESDIGILEHNTSSIEDQLVDDHITYETLPDEDYEETFISVEQKEFTEEELAEQNKVAAQQSVIIQDSTIVSRLEQPIKLNEMANPEQIMYVFNELVYFSEEYHYWNWNKEENIIIFFQKKLDRPVYYNQNGLVLIFLNDDNEMIFYIQTMLGETESLAEKRKLMQPVEAIETLYIANELPPESHIDSVDIGFYTRVPFETEVQVFAPIWKVKVNGEKDYFVNAIEGFIFSADEEEFLQEAMILAKQKLQPQWRNNELIDIIYALLDDRTDETVDTND